MVLFAVATCLLASMLPVTSARAAGPVPALALPPTLDLADVYQGQSLCSPTAKPGATALSNLLAKTYGSNIWRSIERACNTSWDPGVSEHKDGRAVDWGVSAANSTKALGDQFYAWATANNGANARRLGIMYLIWDSRMWRGYDMAKGFNEYRSCLSAWTTPSYDTTCHRDHMHISMTWHGAAAQTSWYSGKAVTQPTCRATGTVAVKGGSAGSPATIFDPLGGVGVAGSCYLGSKIQTLKVPGAAGKQTVQRLRVTSVKTNAPVGVKLWTSAGAAVTLPSGTATRDVALPVGANNLIYLQQPAGQASLRIQAIGQTSIVGAGQTVQITVAGGSTGVPADAKAVALNLTATEPTAAGFLRAYPCGSAMPATSNLNFVRGQTIANSSVVGVGTGGKVCVYTSAPTQVVVDYTGYFPAKSPFQPAAKPQRLTDTRTGGAKPAAATDVAVKVPAGAAAALGIAVTEPAAAGWVAAYPCGTKFAGTSNVNFTAGQTIAASVLARPGADGRVCLRTSTAAHLVVDLQGVYQAGGGFSPIAPKRVTDTRTAPGTPLKPNTDFALAAPANASAVAVNVTGTASTAAGWIQAYPCGAKPPTTSTVNYDAAQNRANSAIIQVGTGGKVCFRSMSQTHLVVDLTATFTGKDYYVPAVPVRLLDTRS